MTTAANQHHHARQPPQLQIQPAHDFAGASYDPDHVGDRDSPLMKALHPNIRPSPSPPPDIPPAHVSLSPSPTDGPSKSNRHKIRPSSGDAVLVAYLDNGRRPDIAHVAGRQALPIDDHEGPERCLDSDSDNNGDEDDEDNEEDDSGQEDEDDEDDEEDEEEHHGQYGRQDQDKRGSNHVSGSSRNLDPLSAFSHTADPSLQNLAAGALKAAGAFNVSAPEFTNDISASARQLSIRDDRPGPPLAAYPLRQSPSAAMLTPGELPPLLDSPRSEANGQSLPSIRSTLGDFDHLPTEPPLSSEKDLSAHHAHGAAYPRSPTTGVPRLHAMSAGHVSPPVSPHDAYPRNFPLSPNSLPASSPYFHGPNGLHHRPSIDYSSSNATGETPSTDQTSSTPATSASIPDRMSIDGITNPPIGVYLCNYPGCTAPPFQTQYLLNSHANVHSSARPHYCPVQDCPRSEGGKGFKRKNEMIRHGLVHDSPGYVCPFCPDREHKYPRPDNLQRCVSIRFGFTLRLPVARPRGTISCAEQASLSSYMAPRALTSFTDMSVYITSTRTKMIRSCGMCFPSDQMGRTVDDGDVDWLRDAL